MARDENQDGSFFRKNTCAPPCRFWLSAASVASSFALLSSIVALLLTGLLAIGCSRARNDSQAIRSVTITEWGAPWTPMIEVTLLPNGDIRIAAGKSSDKHLSPKAGTRIGPEAMKQMLALLPQASVFGPVSSGEMTDVRRLRIRVETVDRAVEVVIRGTLLEGEARFVRGVNAILPGDTRFSDAP